MCAAGAAATVVDAVNQPFFLGQPSGVVYVNAIGIQDLCVESSFPVTIGGQSPLVLVGPSVDLFLVCENGFIVDRGTVAVAGVSFTGSDDADVISTGANSGAHLILGGVKTVGGGLHAGVQIATGTTGTIVAVQSVGVQTPFLFRGSGLLANSISVPVLGGTSRLEPASGSLEAHFNTFAAGGAACSAGTVFTDSLVNSGGTCSGGGVHQVVLNASGRETNSAGHLCTPRAGLAFDVDLQRRTGTSFACGADEAAR